MSSPGIKPADHFLFHPGTLAPFSTNTATSTFFCLSCGAGEDEDILVGAGEDEGAVFASDGAETVESVGREGSTFFAGASMEEVLVGVSMVWTGEEDRLVVIFFRRREVCTMPLHTLHRYTRSERPKQR